MPTLKVALIGANGNVGGPILKALLAADHHVTVLQRASSTSTTPSAPNLQTVSIPDDFPTDALISAIKGHDACVTAIPLKDLEQHLRIATAAAEAGVRRYIPADYGSVDALAARSRELVPLFERKAAVYARLRELSERHADFGFTGLVNGHFFDWALKSDFVHFDLKRHRADILGDGEQRSSLTTLARVADAVAKVLSLGDAEEVRDRVLFFQSFCITQWELLAAVEKATGRKWEVNRLDIDEFIRENKVKADEGSVQAIEELVFALGIEDGDWEQRDEFAMDVLGFENEDLQSVVDDIVREVQA